MENMVHWYTGYSQQHNPDQNEKCSFGIEPPHSVLAPAIPWYQRPGFVRRVTLSHSWCTCRDGKHYCCNYNYIGEQNLFVAMSELVTTVLFLYKDKHIIIVELQRNHVANQKFSFSIRTYNRSLIKNIIIIRGGVHWQIAWLYIGLDNENNYVWKHNKWILCFYIM